MIEAVIPQSADGMSGSGVSSGSEATPVLRTSVVPALRPRQLPSGNCTVASGVGTVWCSFVRAGLVKPEGLVKRCIESPGQAQQWAEGSKMDTAAICVVLKRLSLEISKQAQQIEWALRDTPPSVAGGKRDLLETDLRLRLESWNTEIDGLKRQIAQNENRLKMEKQRWRSPQSSAGKEQELERCRRALGAALARLYKAQNSSTAPTGMAADLGIIELADALTKPAVEFVKLAEQPTRPVFMDGTVKPPGGGTALTLLIVGRVLAAMIKKARSKG